jgi:hypothetical protein
MLHYPLWSPQPTHILLQLKLTKPPGSLSIYKTSPNRFRIFYRSPMTSKINTMINTGRHLSLRWVTKFGCTCRKSALHDPIKSFSHSVMGHTPSPRLWVIIISELNIPPFLGLHPMFNVDILRPYFPPLFDTSEIEEQLTPTKLYLNCIQEESSDHIVEKNIN